MWSIWHNHDNNNQLPIQISIRITVMGLTSEMLAISYKWEIYFKTITILSHVSEMTIHFIFATYATSYRLLEYVCLSRNDHSIPSFTPISKTIVKHLWIFSNTKLYAVINVQLPFIIHNSNGWLNIKTSSYMYGNSHYKDKTLWQPSHLYNGNLVQVFIFIQSPCRLWNLARYRQLALVDKSWDDSCEYFNGRVITRELIPTGCLPLFTYMISCILDRRRICSMVCV